MIRIITGMLHSSNRGVVLGEEVFVCCHGCKDELEEEDEVIVMDYTDDSEIDKPWYFHRECIDPNSIENSKVLEEGKWKEVRMKLVKRGLKGENV